MKFSQKLLSKSEFFAESVDALQTSFLADRVNPSTRWNKITHLGAQPFPVHLVLSHALRRKKFTRGHLFSLMANTKLIL